jgi:hypothetical protein
MNNNLLKLNLFLNKNKYYKEVEALKSIASKLKKFQIAEKSGEPPSDKVRYDASNIDKWMLWVADDLSEILNLHAPVFIGASSRAEYEKGAYAFSASNDAGESVVMKILPENELNPYVWITQKKEFTKLKIMPKVYLASSFKDLNYKPPIELSNKFAVVVMEELEEAPRDLLNLLTEDSFDPNNLRLVLNDKKTILNIINICVNNFASVLKFELDLDNNIEKYRKIEIINNSKHIIFDEIKKLFYSLDKDNLLDERHYIYLYIRKKLSNIVENYIKSIKEFDEIDFYTMNNIISSLVNCIDSNLSNTANNSLLQYNLNIPGAKEFYESLKELEKYGVYSNDLHSGNIMIRPSTGEIVIADIGHFF